MTTVITVFLCMFVVGLIGWTTATYILKKDSKELIEEEVKNLVDICKMLFVSLKSLVGGLIQAWSSSDPIVGTPSESKGLEVVEPIAEEENKVA